MADVGPGGSPVRVPPPAPVESQRGRTDTLPGPPGEVGLQLTLLDAFELRDNGQVVELSTAAQRLLAFLALHDRPLRRGLVAGTLWMDATEERAAGNLRSTLWRIARSGRAVVACNGKLLGLAPGVGVDLRDAVAAATRLSGQGLKAEMDLRQAGREGSLLSAELLPGWYDDWVVIERERIRQLRLHSLETLCQRLTVAGYFAQAIDAGLAAVKAEPLRESAHRTLIAAHLAEGNHNEALRQYDAFRVLLHGELRLLPSPQMETLVGGLRP